MRKQSDATKLREAKHEIKDLTRELASAKSTNQAASREMQALKAEVKYANLRISDLTELIDALKVSKKREL